MSNDENVNTVKNLYAAFGTGDLQNLLAGLDAGIEWAVPGAAPWSGEGGGHEHVQRFFQAFGTSASLKAFNLESLVAEGDKVVVLGYEEGTRVRARHHPGLPHQQNSG